MATCAPEAEAKETGGTGRIGIFGGTFDPPHESHLALARLARDCGKLDKVWLVPAPEPPHKRGTWADYEERVAMLELALAEPENAGLCCSRIEETLPRPSYTIQTLKAVMARRPGCRFFLILGMDSLEDLPRWHRAGDICALASLIVANRERANAAEIQGFVARLRPAFSPVPGGENRWQNEAGQSLVVLPDCDMPHSSTKIRTALMQSQEPEGLCPAVREYIREHGLYASRVGQEKDLMRIL